MADTDTTPVNASLIMDRSTPLGNSLGPDGRRRLHVKVDNANLEAIPVFIVDEPIAGLNPVFFDYNNIVTGDAPVTIISTVVSNPFFLSNLIVSCRIEAYIEVKKNGDIIGTLRTGAAKPNVSFDWSPNRPCSTADTIEVVLTKRSGTSDISVGAHLMGVTTTI